jgi:hypothetical protein
MYSGELRKAPPRIFNYAQDQVDQWVEIQELELLLKTQYINFENIGINYLKDVDIIYDEICLDFLDYIDSNYINIRYLENIKSDGFKLQSYTRNIYEILFVDIIDILNKIDIVYDQNTLKFNICQYFSNYLDAMNKIKSISKDLDLKNQILKNSIGLDLFDNDLELFITNFLAPIQEYVFIK